MSLAMNKNANVEATPEQLLALLDLQLATQRQQRKHRAHSRPLLLGGSLLLILGGAVAAFIVLHGMLGDVAGGAGRTPVLPPAESLIPETYENPEGRAHRLLNKPSQWQNHSTP